MPEIIKKQGFVLRITEYINQEEAEKGNFTFQYWRLDSENSKLENGLFFYKGEYDFIHFTGLNEMYSILNSGRIRLYNLLNLDDKYEFIYGYRELCYPENKEMQRVKEELFCLSLCSYKDIIASEDETKEHLLWKLYGNNGDGAMLRLQFINDPRTWYQYHLSEVYYDTVNMEEIKQFHRRPGNKVFLDPKLSCFYKNSIYSFENEVRLIFDKRHMGSTTYTDKDNKLLYPIIHPDQFKEKEDIYYFELPLWNFLPPNSEYLKTPNVMGKMELEIPKIYLKEIILGYHYSEEDVANIAARVKKIDPGVDVKMCRLKKYY